MHCGCSSLKDRNNSKLNFDFFENHQQMKQRILFSCNKSLKGAALKR
jgi:hypothetical protein